MQVFQCPSCGAVKKGRDEGNIKDNSQNEYKYLPTVNSHSLFKPNWIGGGGSATLLLAWQ